MVSARDRCWVVVIVVIVVGVNDECQRYTQESHTPHGSANFHGVWDLCHPLCKPDVLVTDTLKIVVTVDAKNKSTFKFILGGRGAKISQISRDIQETLANFFLQNVNFKLTVVPKFTVIHNDVQNTTLKPNISI